MKKIIEVLQRFPDGKMITPNCEGWPTEIRGIKLNNWDEVLLMDSDKGWWRIGQVEPNTIDIASKPSHQH